jgi:hypothetical protein
MKEGEQIMEYLFYKTNPIDPRQSGCPSLRAGIQFVKTNPISFVFRPKSTITQKTNPFQTQFLYLNLRNLRNFILEQSEGLWFQYIFRGRKPLITPLKSSRFKYIEKQLPLIQNDIPCRYPYIHCRGYPLDISLKTHIAN